MPGPTLTADSPMGEILDAYPGARRALFSRYHLGGCQSCGFSPNETLAQLARRSGDHDPEEMLAHLVAADEHDRQMLVSPEDAKRLLDGPNPPRLVDARTREEFEAVRIEGAEFMTEALQQQLFAGDPGQPVLLYDHQGKHVLDHCSWFQGHGLKNAVGIDGGIDAWSRAVDPSVRRYRLEID